LEFRRRHVGVRADAGDVIAGNGERRRARGAVDEGLEFLDQTLSPQDDAGDGERRHDRECDDSHREEDFQPQIENAAESGRRRGAHRGFIGGIFGGPMADRGRGLLFRKKDNRWLTFMSALR